MRKVNNQSGFTLLEILVVIIIVGVLASVAMPTLFANVERSRSAEALNAFGLIKRGVEACATGVTAANVGTACNDWTEVGVNDPSNSATRQDSHFTYTPPTVTSGAGGIGVVIVATRVSVDGGTAGDLVTLTRSSATGIVTRTGSTAFASIQ